MALVWFRPRYGIQFPERDAAPRQRRESVNTVATPPPTLIELELEPPKVTFVETKPDEDNAGKAPRGITRTASEPRVKTLCKKRSQVFNKISSSVAPVARRVAVPARKLSASVTKISPRNMVVHAHAKCNSIISGVHDHLPRSLPHLRKVDTMPISRPDGALISCSTTTKVPTRDFTKWRLPRKRASI